MKKKNNEYAINMVLNKMMILQQTQFSDPRVSHYFDNYSPCHIYFICRRPRITIDLSKTNVSKEYIDFAFKIHKKGNLQEKTIRLENPIKSDELFFESDFPYTNFKLSNPTTKSGIINVSLFLQHQRRLHPDFPDELLELEILYIGQSYGKKGERKATERLKNHETLQTIYYESMIRNPDDEIWVALCHFEEVGVISIDGGLVQTEEEAKKDNERLSTFLQKVTGSHLDQKQKINFTEAALIKYFEPPYNKDFIDSFPSITHSSYQECYELDINSVMIELNTMEMISCNFYSQKVPSHFIHLHSFWFHDKEERRSLFQIDFEGLIKPS